MISVSLIDIVGSITSRMWNYNYVNLTFLSSAVYTAPGYYIASFNTLEWAVTIPALVGIYDGTIGWKLAIDLKANLGKSGDQAKQSTSEQRIIFMIIFGGTLGFIGFQIGKYLA